MGKRKRRLEYKYLIGKKDYYLLKQLLPRVLKHDANAVSGERYNVRSIYFDDPFNTALYEKSDGAYERKKFRIRYYDLSDSFVKLEKKEKIGGVTYKTDMVIDRSIIETSLKDPLFLNINDYQDPLYKEFVLNCKTQRLTPKVIVEYMREAFVLNYDDIRICFDSDIQAALPSEHVYTDALVTTAVMDEPLYVFEVKYSHYLPNFIREMVQQVDITQTAFSKYGLSRLTLDKHFKYSRL